VISGKVPSTRAKRWRFYQGYLKKCGDIALTGVNKSIAAARLQSGVIGVKVSIMPSTTKLPDDMQVLDTPLIIVESLRKPEEKKKRKRPAKKAESKKKGEVAKKAEASEKVEAHVEEKSGSTEESPKSESTDETQEQ
jgi:ribosomal protein S3